MTISLPAFPTFPKLALLLSVAGLLAGWGVSFLITPSYVSEATLVLTQKPGSPPTGLLPDIGAMELQVQSRTSLSAIIRDVDLYRSERRRQPLEDVIETMRTRDLRIGPSGTPAAFTISFTASDPAKAHDTVQALVTQFVDANVERQGAPAYVKRQRTYDQIDGMEARIAALEKRLGMPPTPPEPLEQIVPASGGTSLEVLDPPSQPVNPIWPDHLRFMYIGFGSGLIAALIVAFFRRSARPAVPFPTVFARR
jgi:uncharacterized protein involved in exopolysaccharide biosynthesis